MQIPTSKGTAVLVGVIQNKMAITDFETRTTVSVSPNLPEIRPRELQCPPVPARGQTDDHDELACPDVSRGLQTREETAPDQQSSVRHATI
jgi:hypothetical protein